MEIAFGTKSLRNICENENEAKEIYGLEVSEALKTRLAEMIAIRSMEEMPTYTPQDYNSPQFKLNIIEGWWLIFCVDLEEAQSAKEINWSKVIRVKILKIESIHESAK